MIRNGRRGRAAGTAGMAASWPPVLSAVLAVPAAAIISATATTATHSRWCHANATTMTAGAAITRTSASHRSRPRLARNQYPPASTAHTLITANAASVTLRHPATASTSATAASIKANEARASQRRVIIVIRDHPHKQAHRTARQIRAGHRRPAVRHTRIAPRSGHSSSVVRPIAAPAGNRRRRRQCRLRLPPAGAIPPQAGQAAVLRILSLPCWKSASVMTPRSRRSDSLARSSAVLLPCAASWM